MCCGGMYPNLLGAKIASLTPGTEVELIGLNITYTDIVWKVEGFSALTAKGRTLSCSCGFYDIIETGRHFDEYEVSEAAELALKEIDDRKRVEIEAEEFGIPEKPRDPDWTVPVNFPSEPE